jgi:endonuclease YncB( thermonuclease family)
LSFFPAAALDLPTYAHDGDNIIIAGQDHRLEAVDAFEAKQKCKAGTEVYKSHKTLRRLYRQSWAVEMWNVPGPAKKVASG